MTDVTAIDSTNFLPLERNLEVLCCELDAAKRSLASARQTASQIRRQRWIDRCTIWYLGAACGLRKLIDGTIGLRLGAFLIGVTLVSGLSYAATTSVDTSIVVGTIAAIPLICLLYLPNDLVAKSRWEELAQTVRQLDNSRLAAATEVAARKLHLQQLKANYKALRRQFEAQRLLASKAYRLQQMARSNWRELKGQDFERFLQRVFIEHGYAVKMTPATGDQGADLIVTLNGKDIAVQAKGYSSYVGNDAVMQALAGKIHYKCHAAVVITTSHFSKKARELAASTGCLLIDGNSLNRMIYGKIDLFKMCFSQEVTRNVVRVKADLIS